MSSKKEEKAPAAAEKIRGAKGLSRAQAERAATSAAGNVNAYLQKEEGPSRMQEQKEAKREMNLMSIEKAVNLGERNDNKSSMPSTSGSSSQCQKCYQMGHWANECRNQQAKNPRLKLKLSISLVLDMPDILNAENDEKNTSKRKHRSHSDSGSETSEASVFETDNGSSSVTGSDYSSAEESSSSYSSSSDSDEKIRTKKKKRRHHHKYSSTSESSDSDSGSDSDISKNIRKKSQNQIKRR